ncbi:MAG: MerR family transcriptional regulator [Burkholderiales bacterium]|nr:MAG: MerR family transcriptional regulator [Burkholderiales bacterium]
MDYTVGELAKRAGLTVRTLHHYEELGLLTPSGRSDAGYRRYREADVLRLHRVLALRDACVPLKDIVPLLDGEAPPAPRHRAAGPDRADRGPAPRPGDPAADAEECRPAAGPAWRRRRRAAGAAGRDADPPGA